MTMLARAIGLFVAVTLCAAPAVAQMPAGQPSLSKEMLEDWLTTFQGFNADGQTGSLDLSLVAHLNLLNDWIRSQDDIRLFREWEKDDEIIRGLIPLSAGPQAETRSPATLILGNVVDNTNVCYLIAYLANTADIGANGQFNLLQVIRQVANYAFTDTAVWIDTLIQSKAAQLKGQSDVENTMQLLNRIGEALRTRPRGQLLTLRTLDERKFEGCVGALPKQFVGEEDLKPLFPDTISGLTMDVIRERLFSDARREYATHLATLYNNADEAGRAALVSAIISAIIPQNEDPERRYRVNLYIAVTFTRMAAGALKESADQEALQALRNSAEYSTDPTFRQNVDQAITRQGL